MAGFSNRRRLWLGVLALAWPLGACGAAPAEATDTGALTPPQPVITNEQSIPMPSTGAVIAAPHSVTMPGLD